MDTSQFTPDLSMGALPWPRDPEAEEVVLVVLCRLVYRKVGDGEKGQGRWTGATFERMGREARSAG